MSRKGNPCDDTIMQSFYRTSKRKLVRDHNDNPEQDPLDIFKYIIAYYNPNGLVLPGAV